MIMSACGHQFTYFCVRLESQILAKKLLTASFHQLCNLCIADRASLLYFWMTKTINVYVKESFALKVDRTSYAWLIYVADSYRLSHSSFQHASFSAQQVMTCYP